MQSILKETFSYLFLYSKHHPSLQVQYVQLSTGLFKSITVRALLFYQDIFLCHQDFVNRFHFALANASLAPNPINTPPVIRFR